MVWNKYQPFTRNGFCEHVYSVARETMRGLRTDAINGKVFLPYWWHEGVVRVFWERGIPEQTVDLIVNAVNQRVRETIDLSFDFELYGAEWSVLEQIEAATVRGTIDEERLFRLALSEPYRDWRRGGRQHADIYITTRPFVGDPVNWGASRFNHGAMVFALHGERHRHHDFLRQVALHETNHLLGMYCHCDDYQNVAGLRYTPTCNMHGSCAHAELCTKCRTHISWWWQGVQDEAREAGALRV